MIFRLFSTYNAISPTFLLNFGNFVDTRIDFSSKTL
jgi:hypothetical protein